MHGSETVQEKLIGKHFACISSSNAEDTTSIGVNHNGHDLNPQLYEIKVIELQPKASNCKNGTLRFRTLEINIQSCLLTIWQKVFSNSRFEKLFGDGVKLGLGVCSVLLLGFVLDWVSNLVEKKVFHSKDTDVKNAEEDVQRITSGKDT
ncbi:uncharacterized protein HKW66_Vig0112790 [Vigna angularis]|uniref:Uncharacterized protein n=1 Tax=Phaseolus angularis TaxID=3914 RepID=A0A8T0KWL8_PHAAN|nr:uncharacterized protein HKW66_Vig0112790 [Vigna angularis]